MYNIHNLELADVNASKGKGKQPGVILHRQNADVNLWNLQKMLIDKTYRTSQYTTFKITDPKEREIFRLPYFPDRVAQHAIANILVPIWTKTYTADTYSCIKGRGIHAAKNALANALRDQQGTKYCLKMDIRKFYPSIDQDILKSVIRRKIKDPDLLWLLDEIIDSADGLPIGNYLSQHFANLYLTYFDHWLKEKKGVRYYFRYCDDLVILSHDKAFLHQLLAEIKEYLGDKLKLVVKSNHQIFPVAARGIDFVGYVSYHGYTRLRKSIKKRFAKAMSKKPSIKTFASYYGWCVHANCRHFLNLIIHEKFPRIRHQAYIKKSYRPKHPNGGCLKPRNSSIGLQNSTID